MLYVKSSTPGDESDYIVDYKRRFPSYPHETTADQLFSEEQFEAYRALGFHAVSELLLGSDNEKCAQSRRNGRVSLNHPLVKDAKELLKWTRSDQHPGNDATGATGDAILIPANPAGL